MKKYLKIVMLMLFITGITHLLGCNFAGWREKPPPQQAQKPSPYETKNYGYYDETSNNKETQPTLPLTEPIPTLSPGPKEQTVEPPEDLRKEAQKIIKIITTAMTGNNFGQEVSNTLAPTALASEEQIPSGKPYWILSAQNILLLLGADQSYFNTVLTRQPTPTNNNPPAPGQTSLYDAVRQATDDLTKFILRGVPAFYRNNDQPWTVKSTGGGGIFADAILENNLGDITQLTTNSQNTMQGNLTNPNGVAPPFNGTAINVTQEGNNNTVQYP